MRKMVALLALCGLVACGGGGKDEDSGGGAGDVGVDGADVYAANCGTCHATDGSGGIGPPLDDGLVAGLSDERLFDVIVNGLPPSMPSFALPQDEIDALIAYLRSEFG
jgi:mono/diheme cytochrome c family protein